MRDYIEIELIEGADAMKICDRLNTFTNIKCSVITMKTIRVWFNENKIAAKKLLKIIAAITNQDHRKRKRNVVSVKSSSPYRTNNIANENSQFINQSCPQG
jgi:hypothetical protein